MEGLLQKVQQAKDYILGKINTMPQIGLILGSGLGSLADEVEDAVVIDYKDIPNFPVSTVEGHAGELVIGQLQGKSVVVMKGRFHYYEGYSMQQVTFPVRVMKAIGIELLFVTNACGGLNPQLYPGALMMIQDHINFIGANPLIGPNYHELGPRFPDMSSAYDKDLIQLAHRVGKDLSIETHEGVYIAISGPNYLTKAELKMIIAVGADTVGMSTVPEVIVARHSGLRVLGISCVTDMAIPDQLESISHEEVMEVANKTKPKFISLVKEILKEVTLS
ncbi:purine-nucleoside phosphorylase [Clostridium formicaceticum]|uniref:Purine nucleoside phosphorylase n=1 Tax=Clostridium formicaceticum TaxID=1497 RepID=A0AAC9WGA5_9CLOT|nr:purine-nucleoside phosphorylase [Clostridium formicaceticum]AOY77090.1 purine-nucleoside phosphorylase [Clostridium formicaceticum]ARE87599.1 Purine nucleoside phosphorylase 1 [Clostridium formicaceticum]